MAESLFWFFIIVGIFAIGDLLGVFTKAKVSSIFVAFVAFLFLFVTKLFPANIVELSGLSEASSWAMPLLIVHMGTLIDIRRLIDEWRTVVTAAMGMLVACVAIFLVSPIIGRDATMVSIPVINGALVATNIMAEAATAKGMVLAASLAPVVFAVQKFVGAPMVSRAGLKEGERLLEEFRKNKSLGKSIKEAVATVEVGPKKQTFAEKHSKLYTNNVCIALTVCLAFISVVIGDAIGISYSIVGLVLSVAIKTLGFFPDKILERAKVVGFVNFVGFVGLMPSLAKVSLGDLGQLFFQVALVFGATILGIFICFRILPLWKVVGSKNLAVGVAFCQMLGFPSTYLISNEIANVLAENEEERTYLLEKIMPRFVVAGLASVTVLSVIVAGIFADLL